MRVDQEASWKTCSVQREQYGYKAVQVREVCERLEVAVEMKWGGLWETTGPVVQARMFAHGRYAAIGYRCFTE